MRYDHLPSRASLGVSEDTRPLSIEPWDQKKRIKMSSSFKKMVSCLTTAILILTVSCLFVSGVYFFYPARINFLILGIDRSPEGTAAGRSDTNILATVLPLRGYVGLLSIPRDLWVSIPGIGENRINTAHFFAESQQPGDGPLATMETIRENFGVDVHYYVRVQFSGLEELVDVLGGIDITLDEQMAGYPPGNHHLSGEQALAFVRDRQDSDDFFRMAHGQFFIKQLFSQLLRPSSWPHLPAAVPVFFRAVDTNIPIWVWPRVLFTFARCGPDRIDSRIISREMTNPTVTTEGAQVLIPDWTKILPLTREMFGE